MPPSVHNAALPSAQPVPSATVSLMPLAAPCCCRWSCGRALGCQAMPVRRSVDALRNTATKRCSRRFEQRHAATLSMLGCTVSLLRDSPLCNIVLHHATACKSTNINKITPEKDCLPPSHLKPSSFLQPASAVHSCTPPLQPQVAITLPSAENRRSVVKMHTTAQGWLNKQQGVSE